MYLRRCLGHIWGWCESELIQPVRYTRMNFDLLLHLLWGVIGTPDPRGDGEYGSRSWLI